VDADLLLRTMGRIADGDDLTGVMPGQDGSSDEESADELAFEMNIIASIAREYRRLGAESPSSTETAEWPTMKKWGQFELLDVVGEGSYGKVFRTMDPQLQREVALKLYHGRHDADRVIEEGRRLAKVRHPNVVTVHGADVVDGVAGIWMELIKGRGLDEVVSATGPMSAKEATNIGLELAGALAAVHHAGLIHRDVKAQNVMRADGGRIVLMDLGASLSETPLTGEAMPHGAVGTPTYMAPELFEFKPATRETDIYSLGVLLYFLVTGQFPVQAPSIEALRTAHRARQSRSLRDVRPDLPRAFVEVVTRMIAHDPAARYATAGDLERDLAALAAGGRRSVWPWVAVAAATAATVVVGYCAVDRPRPVPGGVSPSVVAVLPIRNLTGDASMDYLAEALTQVLIADLASVHAIRVPPYDAVASFRDPQLASSIIAGKLRADLLLYGSIAAGGDRLGMTVSLVDPVTGRAVWGESLVRDRKDTLATQAEIARLVAAHLSLTLGPAEERALGQQTVNAEAQDLYLRALVDANSPDDARQLVAEGRLRRAVTLDDKFASAWANLALVELRVANNSSFESRNAIIEQVRDSALRAIRLNSSEAQGYVALASLQFYYDWDFRAAESSFKTALDLNPSLAFARQRYGMFLASQNRLNDALVELKMARDQEPLLAQRVVFHAFGYYYLRDYARAEKEMEAALAIDDKYAVAHFGLGRILSAKGDQAGAIREINIALAASRNSAWLFELARVYTVAGRTADARRTMAEIESRRPTDRVGSSADSLAYIAAAAGNLDEAFRDLDEAVSKRVENILWIQVDPRADPLRADPRYGALLHRMGL